MIEAPAGYPLGIHMAMESHPFFSGKSERDLLPDGIRWGSDQLFKTPGSDQTFEATTGR